jgi:hypothetical protein
VGVNLERRVRHPLVATLWALSIDDRTVGGVFGVTVASLLLLK